MNKGRVVTAILLLSAFFSLQTAATSWRDQLNSADELSADSIAAGTQSGGLSLSSINTLLNGGNIALTANTMTNAAGVIEYCLNHKLIPNSGVENIKDRLIQKLSHEHKLRNKEKEDYNLGLKGLLNTRSGQQLDMSTLGQSELANKVKVKACELVLKQGLYYLH